MKVVVPLQAHGVLPSQAPIARLSLLLLCLSTSGNSLLGLLVGFKLLCCLSVQELLAGAHVLGDLIVPFEQLFAKFLLALTTVVKPGNQGVQDYRIIDAAPFVGVEKGGLTFLELATLWHGDVEFGLVGSLILRWQVDEAFAFHGVGTLDPDAPVGVAVVGSATGWQTAMRLSVALEPPVAIAVAVLAQQPGTLDVCLTQVAVAVDDLSLQLHNLLPQQIDVADKGLELLPLFVSCGLRGIVGSLSFFLLRGHFATTLTLERATVGTAGCGSLLVLRL